MVKAKAITRSEVDAREAAEEQQRVNDEARAYLRETDWYVIRALESGKPAPEAIRKARQAARERVVGTATDRVQGE